MTLTLPPSSAPMTLPDTIVFDSVERTCYRADMIRITRDGSTRITRDGSRRKVYDAYLAYPQLLGQVPNMSHIMTLPE